MTEPHDTSSSPSLGPAGWLWVALVGLLVFLAALATRTSMVGLPPIYDELYHLMPAISWQENGTLAILDGIYDRSALFTRFVATNFDLFGARSTEAARLLPAVLPGALLVLVIFLWARLTLGWAVALMSTFLVLFWPNGIEVSQYIRFYALQGLLFVLGVLAVYIALTAALSLRWRLGLLGGAALLLYLALQLQMTTLLGAAALGLWVALVYGPGWLKAHIWVRWATGAGIALVGAVLASGVLTETLQGLWTTYRWQPWPAQESFTFYHRNFRDNYPTLWPLFPFAALIALRARFVPASFCLILFATTFLLQSFGGLKNIRYLYPTMPFFFVLWAIALESLARELLRYFQSTGKAALAPLLPARLLPAAVTLTLVLSGLFLVAANAAFERSLRIISGSEREFLLGKRRWEWPQAQAMVTPHLAAGRVIVTTEEMLAVQWLGDFDFAYNKPRFSELLYTFGPETPVFSADRRTGRPTAGEIADMALVIACHPRGLFLANRGWINSGNARALERIARESGAEIQAEQGRGASILVWTRAEGETAPEACAALPEPAPGAAARLLAGEVQPRMLSSSAKAER